VSETCAKRRAVSVNRPLAQVEWTQAVSTHRTNVPSAARFGAFSSIAMASLQPPSAAPAGIGAASDMIAMSMEREAYSRSRSRLTSARLTVLVAALVLASAVLMLLCASRRVLNVSLIVAWTAACSSFSRSWSLRERPIRPDGCKKTSHRKTRTELIYVESESDLFTGTIQNTADALTNKLRMTI
jgi:hypothetical protein